MGTWILGSAFYLSLMICGSWVSAESFDQSFNLVAPTADTQSVFGRPMLLQLSPHSQKRTVLAACEALGSALGKQQEREAALESCAATSARLFAQVRGKDGAFASIRFKLNSAIGQEVQDFRELSRVVAEFHDRIGWLLPDGLLDQVINGITGSCRSGALEYQFAPERGPIPRYNLTVRAVFNSVRSADQFIASPAVCP